MNTCFFIFINFICGRKFWQNQWSYLDDHQKVNISWERSKKKVGNINLNHPTFLKKNFPNNHFYIFFLFEKKTINTSVMLSWAWFFWSDWFCNSGFWIGRASEISFEMKWFVTLYMSHVTFSWNIMVIGLLDSKLSEEFDIFTKKIAWAHPENEITSFVGGLHLTNFDF